MDCLNQKLLLNSGIIKFTDAAAFTYTNLYVQKSGISFIFSNEADNSAYCVFKNSRQGQLRLPKSILQAYGLIKVSHTVNIKKYNSENYKLVKKLVSNELPMAIPGIKTLYSKKFLQKDNHFIKKVDFKDYAASSFMEEDYYDGAIRIDLYLNKVPLIELRKATPHDIRTYCTYNEIRNEYGNNLSNIQSQKIIFIYPRDAGNKNRINIPTIFKNTFQMKNKHSFNLYLSDKGVYSLLMDLSNDELTEKTIDPEKETVETVTLCNECQQEEKEIKDILSALNELVDASTNCVKENKISEEKIQAITDENLELKRQVSRINKMMKRIMHQMNISDVVDLLLA